MRGPAILVVEDNPITRKMLRFALAWEGYQVIEASDWRTAEAAVLDSVPDLLVLDYVLPEGDGLALRDELRRRLSLPALPALIVGGIDALPAPPGDDPHTELLVKPVEPSRLLAAVRARLPSPERGSGAPAPAAGVQPAFPRLERHLRQDAEMVRQAAIQARTLAMIDGLSAMLAQPHDVLEVVGDLLIQCLDAAGLSTGLLYLVDPEGGLRLQAHCGVPNAARTNAETGFGHAALLRRLLERGEPVAFSAADAGALPEAADLVARVGHPSLLLVPFAVRGEGGGAVLLASDFHNLGDAAWMDLARSIGAQFGQTVALGQSLERLRLMAGSSREIVWLAQPDLSELLYVSPAFEQIVGRTRESLYAAPASALESVHADDRERVAHAAASLIEGEAQATFRIVRADGAIRWLRARGFAIRNHSGAVSRYGGVAEDVTERVGAEARAAELSRRLLQVQEQERRALARELHDETGQIVTGLKLMLETAERTGALDLAQMRELVSRLLERVTGLSLDLRPPMLEDLGLVPALLWHVARYQKQTSTRVLFPHPGAVARLAPETEIAAFRIVQEALTNVARHAEVAEAEVQLWVDDGWLRIRVADRGRGFDPAEVEGRASGIAGMRERAALVGGRLTLESRPGHGTGLLAELPAGAPTAAAGR